MAATLCVLLTKAWYVAEPRYEIHGPIAVASEGPVIASSEAVVLAYHCWVGWAVGLFTLIATWLASWARPTQVVGAAILVAAAMGLLLLFPHAADEVLASRNTSTLAAAGSSELPGKVVLAGSGRNASGWLLTMFAIPTLTLAALVAGRWSREV